MKKLFALALVLVLVLSMMPTAFAAHSHTITIENAHSGYVYDAYQIFSGDVDAKGVLSNVQWGSAFNTADIPTMVAELKAISFFSTCNLAKEFANTLATVPNKQDDPIAIAFADIVAKYAKNSTDTSAPVTGGYAITGLDDGYYIVVNTTVPDVENATHSRYIMEVVADVKVTHKGTFPTVIKKITEATDNPNTPENEVSGATKNEASIGEAVNYKIVGTMPANINDYDTYYYVFTDTLSPGLTYNKDMVITVNGVDVTSYFYNNNPDYVANTATTITVGIQDIKALSLLTTPAVGAITKDTQVVLTYSATLNEYAKIINEGDNPNKVKLTYSNDPNIDGDGATTPPPPPTTPPTPSTPTGVTPESQVTTYTTKLIIEKTDGAGKDLTGAEFELSGIMVKKYVVTTNKFVPAGSETPVYYELKDGTFTDVAPVYDDPSTTDVDEDTSHAYKNPGAPTHILKAFTEIKDEYAPTKVKAFVGDDGFLTFTGLGAGTYTLTEVTTPSGFNTIAPITFTVGFIYDNLESRYEFTSDNTMIMMQDVNNLYGWIKNYAGSVLPSTGGMGTTLFYSIGGILVLAAVTLLITKKRMYAVK